MSDWISIKTKEPRVGQTCLFTNAKVIRVGFLIDQHQIITFAGLNDQEEEYSYDFISEATHWMPLPSPPAES